MKKAKLILLVLLGLFTFFFSSDFGLIDVEKTSIITAIVETVIYENRWGDIRNPFCKALKLLAIEQVEEQTDCIDNELEDELPF